MSWVHLLLPLMPPALRIGATCLADPAGGCVQSRNASCRTVHYGRVTNALKNAQHKGYFGIGNCQATCRKLIGLGTNRHGIDYIDYSFS